jgi:hypothetical protein
VGGLRRNVTMRLPLGSRQPLAFFEDILERIQQQSLVKVRRPLPAVGFQASDRQPLIHNMGRVPQGSCIEAIAIHVARISPLTRFLLSP